MEAALSTQQVAAKERSSRRGGGAGAGRQSAALGGVGSARLGMGTESATAAAAAAAATCNCCNCNCNWHANYCRACSSKLADDNMSSRGVVAGERGGGRGMQRWHMHNYFYYYFL